jgi:2-(1,2-epoxy-1,2-dihydrophenyl)acetyl-CoA isomerase
MDGAVAVVRLDRPDRNNAIDLDSTLELTAFLRQATTDGGTRAIVLTGTGRYFCTGADLAGSAEKTAVSAMDYRHITDPYMELFKALWEVEKPVVSAVNGRVAGVGWMLALLADLVVADSEARWTHVFLRRGMVPHAGDTYFMPRIVPFHRLNELSMLGDTVDSAKLYEWGLVNRVAAADGALDAAMELAQRLATGPTRSLGMTKRLYRQSLSSDMEAAFDAERAATALISTTADRTEGVAAFFDNRPPVYIGN